MGKARFMDKNTLLERLEQVLINAPLHYNNSAIAVVNELEELGFFKHYETIQRLSSALQDRDELVTHYKAKARIMEDCAKHFQAQCEEFESSRKPLDGDSRLIS